MDREFHRVWASQRPDRRDFPRSSDSAWEAAVNRGRQEFQQNAREGHDVPEEDEFVTDEGVEANARLIGMTAALLLVLSTRLNKLLHSTFSMRNTCGVRMFDAALPRCRVVLFIEVLQISSLDIPMPSRVQPHAAQSAPRRDHGSLIFCKSRITRRRKASRISSSEGHRHIPACTRHPGCRRRCETSHHPMPSLQLIVAS